uniref:WD repeat-containing protein 43 n=1 Tax=Phallusia mammillata TaxID=59560 RepID=A0A6F9DXF3_9ASCI|nr:WD repeat-containing protein 43 [Phallusia mammillata]
MTTERNCVSFSSNDKLALCSPDGVLHVWDSKEGIEKQQFTPASHLTATFTCLSWKIRQHQKQNEEKRKRKKLKTLSEVRPFEYVALGTAVGDVLVFNSISGEITAKKSGGHVDRVNDVCWSGDGSIIYSCSNDQHIVEWDLSSPQHKSKWKADKQEVFSVAIGSNSQTLLSAGRLIKLWDLNKKELVRKFSGHASPVISLAFVDQYKEVASTDSPLDGADGLYFISAGLDDRSLSAWQIRKSKHKKTSLCSFYLGSEPTSVAVLSPKSANDPVHVLSVTQERTVAIFSHLLNGPIEKPLQANATIRVCTEEAEPLDVISASFDETSHNNGLVVNVAYGSTLKLAFEKIKLSEHSTSDIVLIRKDPTKIVISVEEDKLKLKVPSRRKEDVSSIVPGAADHIGTNKDQKRKRKKQLSIGESQLTMEERMNALSMDKSENADDSTATPCADSFAVLLSQGLQSNDRDVINQVLQHNSDSLIKNTIEQLPISYIIPLLNELTERLHGSPDKCLIFIKWLRTALSHHASYLMTLPGISSLLNELHQLMRVRTQTQGRLSKLEGKLDLIMSQVVSRKSEQVTSSSDEKALYVLEEDSSDEQDENMMEGMIESDLDDWEEFSDDERKPGHHDNTDDDFQILMDEDG